MKTEKSKEPFIHKNCSKLSKKSVTFSNVYDLYFYEQVKFPTFDSYYLDQLRFRNRVSCLEALLEEVLQKKLSQIKLYQHNHQSPKL